MLKRNFSIIMLIFFIMCVADCSKNIQSTKIQVITTLFPQYDFVRQIAKNKVDVSLLLPAGVEPHSFEPTPKDIINIKHSKLFIYTSKHMEPWVNKFLVGINSSSPVIIDASKNIELITNEEKLHNHSSKHKMEVFKITHNKHIVIDPHFWLDPINAKIMVDNILEGLEIVDKKNRFFYRQNAEEYKQKLDELHINFVEVLKKTKHKTIIYAGHFAFGYFAKRYRLNHISPYAGFSPNAEPTPKKIAELIKTLKATGIKVIYYEELINPKIARTISSQTGAKMMLLHGAHNVSQNELKSGITYISIMKENLEKLKEGLNYKE